MRTSLIATHDPQMCAADSAGRAASSSASSSSAAGASECCEIGDAIAILMSRYPVTYTKAFAAMLASSERTQRTMPELAAAVIKTNTRQRSADLG